MDAALALDRLDQDGRGLGADRSPRGREVVEIDLVEGIDGRLEALEVLGLAACAMVASVRPWKALRKVTVR